MSNPNARRPGVETLLDWAAVGQYGRDDGMTTNWTKKRRAFLEEFLECFNATEAARRAGYKHPNVQGPTLVKLSIIEDEIERRLKAKAMTADEALGRLADMARADISEFIADFGAIDWDAVQEAGHLVKRISHRKGQQSQIELHDAQAALDKILKAHGAYSSNLHITGDVTIEVRGRDPDND
jgi:phage terminase small subunit